MKTSKQAVLAASAGGLWASAALAQPWIQGAGLPTDYAPTGFPGTPAVAISGDGSVVVGNDLPPNGIGMGYLWTRATGRAPLGEVPGADYQWVQVEDLSADGRVVVGWANWGSGDVQAFRWTAKGGYEMLGTLNGQPMVEATSVSADGRVIGGQVGHFADTRAVRWAEGEGIVQLDDVESFVNDVSADGSTFVGYRRTGPGGYEARLWRADGTSISLGDLPGGGEESIAYGVSDDGTYVVGYSRSDQGIEAFLWSESTGMVGLGIPPEVSRTIAHAVTPDGGAVVGESGLFWTAQDGPRFLEDILRERGLSLDGWRSIGTAYAITPDGRFIVGIGMSDAVAVGVGEGYIARLAPPCPADYNGDGEVTLADFTAYRLDYVFRRPEADFNGDGLHTLADFVLFRNAYVTPCE